MSNILIMEKFLAAVASIFAAHSVLLFLPEKNSQNVFLSSFFSQGTSVAPHCEVAAGKGLVGWILRNKEPLLFHAADPSQNSLGYYTDATAYEIRSFMGIPVAGGGVLCLDSRQERVFDESSLRTLAPFAALAPTLAGMADQAQTVQQQSGYIKALGKLAELGQCYAGWGDYVQKVLTLLADATGFSYAALASRNGQEQEFLLEGEFPERMHSLEALPMNSGLAGWAFRNGQSIYNDGMDAGSMASLFGRDSGDGASDFCAAACLPIMVGKSAAAVLCLASETPHVFSPELKSFLSVGANEIGNVLSVLSLRYQLSVAARKGK